ncbi:MAG: hypothetical protein SV062_12395 [Thermodesulfobacteriota bacterium]|nr:hypothetical protein [Thermodesulfobacteriota bacterium]
MVLRKVKLQKILWAFILLLVVCGSIWAVCAIYEFDREGKKLSKEFFGIEKLAEMERTFKNKPTIESGVVLLEKYAFLIKNYDKALFYGKTCIDLGANDTQVGWLVNLWIAKVYTKVGDLEKARYYLGNAFELDSSDLIKENKSIESLELQHVFDSMKRETRKK